MLASKELASAVLDCLRKALLDSELGTGARGSSSYLDTMITILSLKSKNQQINQTDKETNKKFSLSIEEREGPDNF